MSPHPVPLRAHPAVDEPEGTLGVVVVVYFLFHAYWLLILVTGCWDDAIDYFLCLYFFNIVKILLANIIDGHYKSRFVAITHIHGIFYLSIISHQFNLC